MLTVREATKADISAWMRVVETVRHTLPGLESDAEMAEYRQTALRFMERRDALCAEMDGGMGGVLLISRKLNMVCCLAVMPEYRRKGLASALLREGITRMDASRDMTVSTFREGDPQGAAARTLYQRFRFLPGELREDNGAPTQEFIRLRTPSDIPGARVTLCPMSRALFHDVMQQYVADPLMTDTPYIYVQKDCDRFWESRQHDPARLIFAICVQDQPIGSIELKRIDLQRRIATLSIMLTCDAVKNRGFGTDAVSTMLRYAFDELHLIAVHADSVHRNLRSQRVLEKVGFAYMYGDDQFRYYICAAPNAIKTNR